MASCVAPGCKSGYGTEGKLPPGVSRHYFPRDAARRELWIKAVPRANWQPSQTSVLCSLHFTQDDFKTERTDTNPYRKTGAGNLTRPRLKEDAVPRIFPGFKMFSNDLFRYSPDGADPANETDLSDEETDEASEDDSPVRQRNDGPPQQRKPYTEIKEQMYQDKLSELKRQLAQLNEGSHPDWTKKLRRLEAAYKERLRINTIIRDLEIEMVEQDFVNEKKSAVREFEDHKIYLRDQLITELEEKQKMIETERHNMELTGDSMELKPISTRKLRRRANEPTGSSSYGPGEKRRKPTQLSAMTYLLDESDVLDDLKIINKNKAFSMSKVNPAPNTPNSRGRSPSPALPAYPRDIRIEDGKLFYEKRWFRRGQAVQVDAKNGDKFPAMISAIGSEAIWVRRTNDSSKIRIYLTQLAKGKYLLNRRAV